MNDWKKHVKGIILIAILIAYSIYEHAPWYAVIFIGIVLIEMYWFFREYNMFKKRWIFSIIRSPFYFIFTYEMISDNDNLLFYTLFSLMFFIIIEAGIFVEQIVLDKITDRYSK